MESVYGQKRGSADAGSGETWFGRFMQLESSGGFRAVVQQAWKHSGGRSSHVTLLSRLNGSMNGSGIEAAA